MTVKVACPNPKCATQYQVPEDRFGESAKCQKCGLTFTLQLSVDETRVIPADDVRCLLRLKNAKGTPPILIPAWDRENRQSPSVRKPVRQRKGPPRAKPLNEHVSQASGDSAGQVGRGR